MKNRKRMLYLRLTAFLTAVCLAALLVLLIVLPQRQFSEAENRNLKQKPAFSMESFSTGRFEEDFETYVSDQFPFRDMWVKVNAFLMRMTGRTKLNGVFAAKDGYLLRDFAEPSAEEFAMNREALASFSKRHQDINTYLMVVPSAVSVCADLLPPLSVSGNENAYIDALKEACGEMPLRFVDTREEIVATAAAEQAYYRTDHHWTTASAYVAYRKFAAEAGMNADAARYERKLITDQFKGTLSAMSGIRTDETDEIYAYLPIDENPNRVITYVEENEISASFYKTEKLETRDKYAVFFGGNHPLIKIESDTAETRVLLVIKDSYANCMIPFLVPNFKEIVVVDPRYYTGDVDEMMETEGVTDALILYNAETLASDTALRADIAG